MYQTSEAEPSFCAGCEIEVAWPPVLHEGRAYCCCGCAHGGPCCCSYDEVPDAEVTLDAPAPSGAAAPGSIPITAEAYRRLEAELDRLAVSVSDSQATAWQDAISGEAEAPTVVANGELHLLTRRLEKLRTVIASARVVDPDGRVVVGSSVTLEDAEGAQERYVLVAPGEADPRAGLISPESPLGAALLRRRAGEAVEFAAPDGTVRLIVVSVE